MDGADGYLRWKESVLLRLHSVGVAHVLSDEPPAEAAGAAAKKWARDDAVCRGHILYALSDRVFPDYVRHGTGRAVWQAVARTYDLDRSRQYERFLHCFRFEENEGAGSFLEQLAHAEALVATRDPPPSDYTMAHRICGKLPAEMAAVIECGEMSMDRIWKFALAMEQRPVIAEERQELDRKTTTGHHRHGRR